MAENWEDKCWGKTRCVRSSELLSVHDLVLKKGGICSFHYHDDKLNQFFVKSGIVRIVWTVGWQLCDKILVTGDNLQLEPNIAHQFQVLESGEMEEVYWARDSLVDQYDINRFTHGLMLPEEFHDVIALDHPHIIKTDGTIWGKEGDVEHG